MNLREHLSPSNRTSLTALDFGYVYNEDTQEISFNKEGQTFFEDLNSQMKRPLAVADGVLKLSSRKATRKSQIGEIHDLMFTTVAQFDSESGHWKFPKLV